MNTLLLNLIFDCTDENGSLDIGRLSSSYNGNLLKDLRTLARQGYISLLDAEDEICEIELNPKAYRLLGK